MSLLSTTPDYIGPYRVLRPIARGGMAEVFEVLDIASGEHLACKLLVRAGTAYPRFNREYEALSRLNHPGIVRVYTYGLHQGAPWMSMELLDGVPLQRRVKSTGRPGTPERTAEVVRLAFHIADALGYIHDRGLVHRDLKSANVLVMTDGRVKLLDFGTARVRDALEAITGDGEFVGTFSYASPEQITGKVLDARSDLYSFGVLLYRLFTGRRPFDDPDPHEVARQHISTAPRSPRELVPALTEEIERLVLWLLEKKPRNRPSHASEVARALEELAGRPLSVASGPLKVRSKHTVGRDSEQREIWDTLELRRPGEALVVLGDHGSGRLHFVDGIGAEAQRRGWAVFTHTFRRGGTVSGVLELLQRVARSFSEVDRGGGSTVGDLLVKLPRDLQLGQPRQRRALELAGSTFLARRTLGGEQPILVVLQQIHRAAPPALEILAGLRRGVTGLNAPVLFLASCDPSYDEAWELVRQRLPDAQRVVLQPLSLQQVALVVGTLLQRRPPPPRLAERIFDVSGGQPAYIEEVVRDLADSGVLRADARLDSRVEWTEGSEAFRPPLVASKRMSRLLRRVPVIERRLLEALALLDGKGTLDVLGRALGCSEEELRPTVDELLTKGWVRSEQGGTVRTLRPLAHPQLLDEMHPSRRNLLERSLGRALADAPGSLPQVRLLLAMGAVDRAVEPALECAMRMLDEGRPTIALEVLDAVAAHIDIDEFTDKDTLGELFLLHANCMLMIRPTDATTARALVRADELVEGGTLKPKVALARARTQWVIGHYPNYRKHLQAAWDGLESDADPRTASIIAAHLGQSYLWAGQPRTAREWFDLAKEQAKLSGNVRVMSHADLGLASWLSSHGDLAEAEKRASEAMQLFGRVKDKRGFWAALALWASSLRQQGRFSEALALLYEHLPDARQSEVSTHYVRLMLVTAWCEMDLYRLGRAQECVNELNAMIRKGEHLHLRLEADLVRGRILSASGQHRDAAVALADVYQRGRSAELVSLAELGRALLAETQWDLGDRDEAIEAFRAATLGLLGTGDRTTLAAACVARARAMAQDEDPASLFAPVRRLLDEEPVVLFRLEEILAKARWLDAQDKRTKAQEEYRRAAAMVNRMARGLNDMDRAALRVHPWTRQIRQGLAAGLPQHGGA